MFFVVSRNKTKQIKQKRKQKTEKKIMPPTGPPRPEYDLKPIHGPGFRPAEGPVGPTGKENS